MIDEPLFRSLAHTFHIIAESEEENIMTKKTGEDLNKDQAKTSKKREIKKQEKEDKEEEIKEHRGKTDFISHSVNQRKIKNMIPGFSLIKRRIITPLLIASERVVEYMIPEKLDSPAPNSSNNIDEENKDENEDTNNNTINDKMSKLTLEDVERRARKRTLKCLRKSNQDVHISNNLLNKCSDCVDFISDRMPVESKVTRNFVTNMIELSDSAMKRIAANCKDIDETDENINMRFIKPSKKFYNLLMSVWVKMDSTSIFNLTESAFIENVKQALEKEDIPWSNAYLEPTKAFFNIAKEEFMNLYKIQKDDV